MFILIFIIHIFWRLCLLTICTFCWCCHIMPFVGVVTNKINPAKDIGKGIPKSREGNVSPYPALEEFAAGVIVKFDICEYKFHLLKKRTNFNGAKITVFYRFSQ